MLADVAEEVEHARSAAVQSALSTSVAWRGPGSKSSEPLELRLDAGDVVVERLAVEQVALLAAAARVADHAGGAAGQRERAVAGQLEAAQRELPDQVPDVQAVGGRVEADVDADRAARPAAAARNSRSVESWMRPRASRSAIRSMRRHRVPDGRAGAVPSVTVRQMADDELAVEAPCGDAPPLFADFARSVERRAPLYAALASGDRRDDALAGLLLAAPAAQRQPVLLFACVHSIAARTTRRPRSPRGTRT